MNVRYTTIFTVIIIFLSGALASWFFLSSSPKADQEKFYKPNQNKLEQDQRQYPLLSKRIFADNQNDILISFSPLRTALREYIEKQENNIGLYFEYLPSGVSIGINDREEIKIASLIKVPVAMSIFKKIEKGQLSLNDTKTIRKENLDNEFGDLWKKGEGSELSVKDLLELSLAKSDNTAYKTLFDELSDKELLDIYESLDIPLSFEEDLSDGGEKRKYPKISPKNFSSIFRSLYLSSFLSREDSNRILEILTQTPFNDKIVAGVPENIKVSHKIGVFEQMELSKTIYTDCGIIYALDRPYTLCAFVQNSEEEAREHISYISKMIYEYITIVKGNE